MNIRVKIVVLIMGLLTFNSLHAERRLDSLTGIINKINMEDNILVINDQAFAALPHLVVHGNTDSIGLRNLSENIPIRYALSLKEGENTKPVITEIWILDRLPSPGT